MCKYCESVDLYNDGVEIIQIDEFPVSVVLVAVENGYVLRTITPINTKDSELVKRCPMCSRPFKPHTYEFKDVFEYVDTLKDDPTSISAALAEMKEMQKDMVLCTDNIANNNRIIKTLKNKISERLAHNKSQDETVNKPSKDKDKPIMKDENNGKISEELTNEIVHPTPEEIGQINFDGPSIEMTETEVSFDPIETETPETPTEVVEQQDNIEPTTNL
jgi:hypothetical protein